MRPPDKNFSNPSVSEASEKVTINVTRDFPLSDHLVLTLVDIDAGNASTSSCPGCGNWGRWMGKKENAPPCCREKHKQVYYSIADAFEKEDVDHSLSGGSLIGALRGGDMVSWDYDIDFFLYTSSENGRLILNEWVRKEKQPGGLLTQMYVSVGGLWWVGDGWGNFNGRYQEHLKFKGDVHLDIGFDKPKPIRPCAFGNRVTQCRADAAAYLDKAYPQGDWMVPRRWCNWQIRKLCPQEDVREAQKSSEARKRLREQTCPLHPQLLIGRGGC